MWDLRYSRRDVLRSSIGLAGLTIPSFLQARSLGTIAPKAKSCIVIYCWGGISHYESWDPKPDAPAETRGEFSPVATQTPGIQFCEHIPLMAQHSDKLAVIRSLHHGDGGHGGAMYHNLTGHKPTGGKAKDRTNWPSLPAMIAHFRDPGVGTPRAIRMPYSMYDNGALMAGEYGGWLGPDYDPMLVPTPAGKPYGGVSRKDGRELNLQPRIERERLAERRTLLERLDHTTDNRTGYDGLGQFARMAADLLLDGAVARAYDLEREDPRIREMYGNHVGGQSMLLARRLVEAGVPVVQVCAGAGDLAGGSGDNWDTHRDHFVKMKTRLLPVFDRAVSALLADLEQRGMLEETIVAVLTDFGRTPKINKNGGRDHYPNVYSTILAGGGIRGGQVHGSSDKSGSQPATGACTPGDLHATVFKALGIDHATELRDEMGRPFRICDGEPLPLF